MDKLTEEQKRIKLAEWAGYTFIHVDEEWGVLCGTVETKLRAVPDYFHCLNAVAKLEEKIIKKYGWKPYKNEVWRIFVKSQPEWSELYGDDVLHASATQRSEAIGITLGLWKEEE